MFKLNTKYRSCLANNQVGNIFVPYVVAWGKLQGNVRALDGALDVCQGMPFLAFQNPEFKISTEFDLSAFQNHEFKILAFENREVKILADFKV